MSKEGANLQYEKMQLEGILASLRDQELEVRAYISSANNAIRSMNAMKSGESSNSVTPLGAGVMAKASIQPNSTVLVMVGKEVVVEMSIDTATNHIETQISEKNAVLDSVVGYQKGVIDRLEFINAHLSKLIESEGLTPGN